MRALAVEHTNTEGDTMTALKKGARITGAERSKLATDLKKAYDKGKSIRELADTHGRSYGFVHRVLSESGATLRGRGGATRTKSADAKATAPASKAAKPAKAAKPVKSAKAKAVKGKKA